MASVMEIEGGVEVVMLMSSLRKRMMLFRHRLKAERQKDSSLGGNFRNLASVFSRDQPRRRPDF